MRLSETQSIVKNHKMIMLKHLLLQCISMAGALSLAITCVDSAPLESAPGSASSSLESVLGDSLPKIKRDSTVKMSQAELDSQETGHYLPDPGYQTTDTGYGYDSGKNAYGKQASDWSLYDQGK